MGESAKLNGGIIKRDFMFYVSFNEFTFTVALQRQGNILNDCEMGVMLGGRERWRLYGGYQLETNHLLCCSGSIAM